MQVPREALACASSLSLSLNCHAVPGLMFRSLVVSMTGRTSKKFWVLAKLPFCTAQPFAQSFSQVPSTVMFKRMDAPLRTARFMSMRRRSFFVFATKVST